MRKGGENNFIMTGQRSQLIRGAGDRPRKGSRAWGPLRGPDDRGLSALPEPSRAQQTGKPLQETPSPLIAY